MKSSRRKRQSSPITPAISPQGDSRDFENLDFQIKINEDRLRFENERYNELKTRIGTSSVLYSIFAVFLVQLLTFWISEKHYLLWYFTIPFMFFLVTIVYSVVNAIRFVYPKEIAHIELPEVFYKEVLNEYRKNGAKTKDVNGLIKKTYLIQVEDAVKKNFQVNNRKSQIHYQAFRSALIAIIPYLICIGIKLSHSPEDVQKIEIVNLNSQTMSDNDKSGNKPEQVKPPQVIVRPPILIREDKAKGNDPKTGSGDKKK